MTRPHNIVQFFGAEHIQRLTGLSAYQLREWDRAGFFAPQYAKQNRRLRLVGSIPSPTWSA
jgi:hypothetical protein